MSGEKEKKKIVRDTARSLALSQPKLLAPDEWDFPITEELLARYDHTVWMLNYEYARSSRWMVGQVCALRKDSFWHEKYALPIDEKYADAFVLQQPPLPRPWECYQTFDVYLANHVPEYPKIPWLQIPEKIRRVHVEAGRRKLNQNPYAPNPITFLRIGDLLKRDRGEFFDLNESYVALKINFHACSDVEISEAFQNWLTQQRATMKQSALEYAQKILQRNPNDEDAKPYLASKFLKPKSKSKGNPSAHKNYRLAFPDLMKYLGRSRLLAFYDYDIELAASLTGDGGSEQYFWKRSVAKTCHMLELLESHWQARAEPYSYATFSLLLDPDDVLIPAVELAKKNTTQQWMEIIKKKFVTPT